MSLGDAWLDVAAGILDRGIETTYDGLPILELTHATLVIEHPDPADATISRFAEPARLAWMRSNFVRRDLVAELGGARSYASRLFDYGAAGVDQLDWIVRRLRADPTSRSATITTFEPLLDSTYIPCVSLLDFWIQAGKLELVVYAHSIDFGAKGYANLIQLAELQGQVAAALGQPVGFLRFIVKSAHIYATEFDYMRRVLSIAGPAH